jgi:hypothetical protein
VDEMRALKLKILVERRVVRAPSIRARRVMMLAAIVGTGLALASCDQKRSIYLDPGRDAEQPIHRTVHAPAPPSKDAPSTDGHKS